MSQTFEPTKKGIRELTRYLNQHGKGTVVYTLAEGRDWGIGSERVYTRHVFDSRSRITGNWMSGINSVAGLLGRAGTVYTEPPHSARFLGDPAPQVAGPLGSGDYDGVFDEDELRGLEKQARQTSNPRTRRPANAWRA